MRTTIEESPYVSVDPSELKTRPPFSDLLPIRSQTLDQITEDMREKGFDPSKPINVWRAENVIVDGHTRQKAAIKAGCDVLVCFHDFKDEDEAMEYAIFNQARRRNLSDAELIRLVAVVDERKRVGSDRGPNGRYEPLGTDVPKGKSSQETAELLGTNYKKVERARRVLDYANATGDTEEKEKIEAGRMTINMGADSVRVKAHRERAGDTPKNGHQAPVATKDKSEGVGVIRANEAINCLKRIPRDDPLRQRAFEIVRDWMKFNR